MFKKNISRFLITFFCLSATSFAQEPELLKTKDIKKVMQQILDRHIDQKQISESIFKKSLNVYIEQFDPDRIYLYEDEVRPYEAPQKDELEKMVDEYKNTDFSVYEHLNEVIQKAILRSRQYRKELEANPDQLFEEAKKVKLDESREKEKKVKFAKDTEDLQKRLKELFIRYIQEGSKRYGESFVYRNRIQMISIFESTLRHGEDQYLYTTETGHPLSPAQEENLFSMHVLKSLATSLDAHTTVFNPAEAYDMRVRLEKEIDGIGIVVNKTKEGFIVVQLMEGGPAAKTGLIKVNDQIIEVDGHKIADEELNDVMSMIQGKPGTEVSLVVKRKLDEEGKPADKLLTVKLNRAAVPVNDDRVEYSYENFGNGIIGKIVLKTFYQSDNGISAENDVREAIKKLDQQGNLRGLILDLRENSGGFLTQAVRVAGLFITNGVIVISKSNNGEEKIYRDMDGKRVYNGPFVILTSKATASAAEIVAQALQDYGVAVIVGDEHTFGKGTIQSQTVTEGEGASYFKVTVGKYYTVSGKTPQMQGVKADVVVPSQYSYEHIGEEYLEYPVPADTIPAEYDDKLQDIDPKLKGWYLRYYIPSLQHKKDFWKVLIPILKRNSEYRVEHNKNYQTFLKQLKGEGNVEEEKEVDELEASKSGPKNFGSEDLQLAEAVNILKDMIFLQAHAQSGHVIEPPPALEVEAKEYSLK